MIGYMLYFTYLHVLRIADIVCTPKCLDPVREHTAEGEDVSLQTGFTSAGRIYAHSDNSNKLLQVTCRKRDGIGY